MTAFERQMFYWKGEADYAYKMMNKLPDDDPQREAYVKQYQQALSIMKELSKGATE